MATEFDGWLAPSRKLLSLQELCVEFLCLNIERTAPPRVPLSADLKEFIWSNLKRRNLLGDGNLRWFDISRETALNLSLSPVVSEIGIRVLQERCPTLQRLKLSYCEGITDAALAVIAAYTSVKHLDLTGCPITDDGLSKLTKATQLLSLSVSHCKKLTGSTLRSLLKKTESLTDVDLSGNDTMVEANISKVKHLKKLSTLNVSGTRVTDSTIAKIISSCAELKNLDISCCPMITDSICSKLIKSASMRTLIFQRSPLGDNELSKIATSMPKLEKLNLSWSPKITDSGVQKLNKLKALTHLELVFTTVNKPVAQQLQKESPQLAHFYHYALKKPL